MLTVIRAYIYFNFAIINILLIVQNEHLAKTRHTDEMDWVLSRMPWAGYGVIMVGPLEHMASA